jgi:chromosome segregation ATPase
METKRPAPARLSVDEETKKFLEMINDQISDAMIDLVKRDDLKQSLQEVKVHLSDLVERTSETQLKSLASIAQRLDRAENNNEKLKQRLREVQDELSGVIKGVGEEAMKTLAAIGQSVENVEAITTAIAKEQISLKENADKMVDRIAVIEGQVSTLINQVERLNRPWWRKLLG